MAPSDEERLDSWKEIAAYLKRDITTVQRWEKREVMPVRRHLHDKIGSVYAFRSELDDWARSRHRTLAPERCRAEPEPDGPSGPAGARRLSDSVPPLTSSRGASAGAGSSSRWLVAGGALVIGLVAVWWALGRAGDSWQNPLTGATFQKVTDLSRTEQAAAVSRDGRFVAFLSDRDGRMDVWITQVGTGQFYNLTSGRVPELVNQSVRTLGFSPDGALVTFWARGLEASDAKAIGIWAVPTLGGPPRPYLDGAAELGWSYDGSRLAYHTPGPGDPTFVKALEQQGPGRQIFAAAPGLHAHFPSWSPSGAFIYFVQGSVPNNMDVWRIRPAEGTAERITFHNSQVSHPVLLDERTVMYLATDPDGSGPWLFSTDVERRVPHRVSTGLDRYTSLAATKDGRRLVATLANPTRTLWRLTIADVPADAAAARPVSLTTGPGFSPRLGPAYLLYVSSTGASDVIWKQANGATTQLWSAPETRVIGGPEITPDGRRVAFSIEQRGRTRLYVVNADGTDARVVTESLALEGAPAWAPDGQSLMSAATVGGKPQLFRIPLDGAPAPFSQDYAVDPVWAPDGSFLLYSGADIGTMFPIKAATPAAVPYTIPKLVLTRGERRLRFVAGPHALVVLRGDLRHNNLWSIDLQTGSQRQLTDLPLDFEVRDFDVSPSGREAVLERVEEHSEVVLVDLQRRR
jgi:Tol biopolymer transport system component